MFDKLLDLLERLVVALETMAGNGPATTTGAAEDPPKKRRKRRTKAEIEAAKKAEAAKEEDDGVTYTSDPEENEAEAAAAEDEDDEDLLGEEEVEIDQKTLIGKAREVMKKGVAQKKKVAAILKKFKVKKITELEESDYAAVYEAMEDID